MKHDDLGTRMKEYEQRNRSYLQRRMYTVIRCDGKAFHTYTRGCKKPFDEGLVEDMQLTMKYLCENIQGCKLGYTQSDEISLVLTDFDTLQTDAWFDGQVQKICSIASSLATARFNQLRATRFWDVGAMADMEDWNENSKYKFGKNIRGAFKDGVNVYDYQICLGDVVNYTPQNPDSLAFFDARCFTLPSFTETMNYLRWRQKDAVKNSISMVAQSLYSHKELHKKNSSDKQEMIFQKGQNWNDYPAEQKRGSVAVRRPFTAIADDGDTYSRNRWEIETPDLLKDTAVEYLESIFPPQDIKYCDR